MTLRASKDCNLREWLYEVTPNFNWDWPYLVYTIEKLEAVFRGEIKRLIIEMPPRHGKSTLASVRFPAYVLERDPYKRIMLGSYNQTLAEKFSRQCRRIVSRRIGVDRERKAVNDWLTGKGEGGMRAVGVGGGATGQGADLIIIDDPVKSRKEADSETYRDTTWDWYKDDLYSRLEPGGGIIVIQTRWHEDDLIGRLLADEEGDDWERIRFPALAELNDLLGRLEGEALCPERYNVDALLRIQQVMKHSFQSLYQQRPSAVEGEIFKREYWRFYRALPNFNLKVMSIDTAFKTKAQNDFSCIGVFGQTDTKSCMIDRWKAKVEYPDLKRAVIEMANIHQPNEILIEDKASGQSLIQELRHTTRLPIIAVQVDSDKISRANASVGVIEAGKLELPESAPWLLDYMDTMATFPNGAHDDDVDVTTQYLSRHGFNPAREFYFA